MEYFELIKKRHSVRSYKNDKVEEEKLHKILEAAALAPTAANRQGFKVFVMKSEGQEDKLKNIYNRDWFTKAPLALCICAIPSKCWTRVDGKNYSYVDAAIVMDHIILAATALGLGTCWIGAFNPDAVRQVLGLDDTYEPVALTPLGYAEETDSIKKRKQIDEIVEFR